MRISLVSFLLALSLTASAGVPLSFQHQGRLFDSAGTALDGPTDLTFRLYDAPSGGTEVWSETQTAVQVSEGWFGVVLGAETAINSGDFEEGAELFLAMSIDGGAELPTRFPLNSVPYAITAQNLTGGVVDASELRVNGTVVVGSDGTLSTDLDRDSLADLSCSDDQILVSSGGSWSCADQAVLTEAQVEGFITNGALDLAGGTTLAGAALTTGDHTSTLPWSAITDAPSGLDDGDDNTQLSESQVEGFITNGALDLAAGTTLNSATISTGSHTTTLPWSEISSRPAGLDDGDDNTQLSESQVEGFVTNGAIDLAAGSTVDGEDLATTADLQAIAGSGLCDKMKTVSARTANTLYSQLDGDYQGSSVCGSGWHVCNFQEYTVYAVLGQCSLNSSWIVGGFSNAEVHRRSIWNGQDSTQCNTGNALATYGKWGPYHGRVHCEPKGGSKTVGCCAN